LLVLHIDLDFSHIRVGTGHIGHIPIAFMSVIFTNKMSDNGAIFRQNCSSASNFSYCYPFLRSVVCLSVCLSVTFVHAA